jgi:cell division protein FtsA
LAEYTLEKPAKIGYPRPVGGMGNVMQDPKFSTVLGLLLDSTEQKNSISLRRDNDSTDRSDFVGRIGSSFKNVFKDLF